MPKLTCGLMRGLTQESRNLPFTCSIITNCAKVIERLGSSDESIVSVESITLTCLIVPMFKHFVEKRLTNEAANICRGSKQESKEKY